MKKVFIIIFVFTACFLVSAKSSYAIVEEKAMNGKDGINQSLQAIIDYGNSQEYKNFIAEKKQASAQLQKLNIGSPAENSKILFGEEPNLALSEKLLKNSTINTATSDGSIPPPASSGGDGNNISWSSFYYGDIVVMRDSSCSYFGYPCYWVHAAMYDRDWDTGLGDASFAFWSAYPSGAAPSDNASSTYSTSGKVGLQSKTSIHQYSSAQAVWVPSTNSTQQYNTTVYAYNQRRESFNTISPKTSSSSWYCSKIPYMAYSWASGKNIDYDGGYYIFPDDIYNDGDTSVFAVGT